VFWVILKVSSAFDCLLCVRRIIIFIPSILMSGTMFELASTLRQKHGVSDGKGGDNDEDESNTLLPIVK
jgi:hypothetical protein